MSLEVLTDLSGTICQEQIPIEWIFSYLRFLPLSDKVKLFSKAGFNYFCFKLSKRDPAWFYSTLENLPFVKYPSFINQLTPNPDWDDAVRDTKAKELGVVTQDDIHIAKKYLKTQKPRFEKLGIELKVIAANFADHVNGIYTGEAELNVTPEKIPAYLQQYSTFIGDGHTTYALRNYPALKKQLIEV